MTVQRRQVGPTWVATFDTQVLRVFRVDDEGRLIHVREEGLDARPSADDEPDGLRIPHTEEKVGMISRDAFVRRIVEHLDGRARRHAFDRLIVSAAPGALSLFREHAPTSLTAKVTAELNKDHVHTPVKHLEAALQRQLQDAAAS